MSVREQLKNILEARNISGLARERGLSALDQLMKVVPDLGEAMLADLEPGKIVEVPGDRDKWLIYGSYGDGSYDIIRMDAVKDDRLVGWRPGQSVAEYNRALEEDPDLEDRRVDDSSDKRTFVQAIRDPRVPG